MEFTALKENGGVQMLFANPKTFTPKSGEYIKLMIPWIHSESKHLPFEWHPFSLYLRDASSTVPNGVSERCDSEVDRRSEAGTPPVQRQLDVLPALRDIEVTPGTWEVTSIEEGGATWASTPAVPTAAAAPPSVAVPTSPPAQESRSVRRKRHVSSDQDQFLSQTRASLSGQDISKEEEEMRRQVVRRGGSKYDTTQVFVQAAGNWTEALMKTLVSKRATGSCWVRGPYTSPFAIAGSFSQIILVASGIGITPALAVLNQFAGFSRSCALIWLVRSPEMLEFFAPLLDNARAALIYYTGKKKLSDEVKAKIRGHGQIELFTKPAADAREARRQADGELRERLGRERHWSRCAR